MERNRLLLAASTAFVLTAPAPGYTQPDTACPSPPRLADAIPLSSLVAKAKALRLRKDDYESTSDFLGRAEKAGSTLFGHPLTILWTQPRLTTFDADRGVVMVDRYSVNSTCVMFKYELPAEFASVHVGPGGKYDWQKQDHPYCLTRDVAQKNTGSYTGSNAFGATASVRSIKEYQQGIYLGTGLIGLDYFPTKDFSSLSASPWLQSVATVAEAKSLAVNGALLFTVTPKAPYYATGKYYSGATFTSPTSLSTSIDFMIGDPTCVALVDRVSGKVFAQRAFEIGGRD